MRFWLKPPATEVGRTKRLIRWTVTLFTAGTALTAIAAGSSLVGIAAASAIVLGAQIGIISFARVIAHADKGEW